MNGRSNSCFKTQQHWATSTKENNSPSCRPLRIFFGQEEIEKKQNDEDQKIDGNLLGTKPSSTCSKQDLAKSKQ